MNQIKKTQLIVLAFAVLLLAGLGCKQAENVNTNGSQAQTNQNTNGSISLPNTNTGGNAGNSNVVVSNSNASGTVVQTNSEAKAKSDVEKIARFFTEYFGSYSTDSNFTNVTGLKIYMTQNMQKWADSFVQDAKKSQQNTTGYFGVTTKAVSLQTRTFSDSQGTAQVIVSTQRREATGTSTNARIYYQDMTVSFAKEKGVWKVNEAVWQ